MASKYWFVSAGKQGQIKWIKFRKLKINDGMYISIICTWMRQVGGQLWTLGGWWVMGPEISACIWQVSIGLYRRQSKAKSSRLNFAN